MYRLRHGYYAKFGSALLSYHATAHPSGGIGGAAMVGLICAAMQMIGPDHLCTLMSLSTTVSDAEALRIGAAWGFAHCLGTILVCSIFGGVRSWMAIDPEEWEHYGDYMIGLSLILCSMYFFSTESRYIVDKGDGIISVQGCSCHNIAGEKAEKELEDGEDPPPPAEMAFSRMPRRKQAPKAKSPIFAAGFQCVVCDDENCGALTGTAPIGESSPLLRKKQETSDNYNYLAGAALGLVQGVCCPMVLVSVNCMAYVTTFATVTVFLATYALFSVVGAALFSFGWARLIGGGFSKIASPTTIYRGSCWFTMCFGAAWILANRLNILDFLDYASGIVDTEPVARMSNA